MIIFEKITGIYNCKLITNSSVPSIYSEHEILADKLSFEEYFECILEVSKTKKRGSKFEKNLTGDYIFSRENILHQAKIARDILKKRIK
jgi:hypothetical protein